jgi:prepilin-type N-terminal cleavage/methylation domain-containing protein
MKQNKTFKKQAGFTAIELMVVVAVGFLLLYLAYPRIAPLLGVGKSATVQNHIQDIWQGSINYGSQNGRCTGVSLAVLGQRGLINANLANGTTTSPWGGTYTVACAGTNLTQYQITATGITDATIGAQLAGAYTGKAITSSFASNTLTLVIQG